MDSLAAEWAAGTGGRAGAPCGAVPRCCFGGVLPGGIRKVMKILSKILVNGFFLQKS